MNCGVFSLVMIAQDPVDEPNILAIEYSFNHQHTSIDHVARGLR